MSSRVKILWRVLSCSGIFSIMAGTGLGTAYVNNIVQGQAYLVLGFAFIVLGIVLMATGYLVSLSQDKNTKKQALLTLNRKFES
jgi:predicted membrane channel-forming protein YqfA (hemolysin III family)